MLRFSIHSIPWSGHLGQQKTLDRIATRFYWPGVYQEVVAFCKSCPTCQLTSRSKRGMKAPLVNLPIIDVPLARIAMDVVGPLDKSRAGHKYILVTCDYATRYPEAFPLRNTKSRQVANSLIQLFSRVGIPREIITDQGTNFNSGFMRQVYSLLGIRGIRTTPYHPQTDGMVERFNQTLKAMLRKYVSDTVDNWDQWLPYLLFAYREVPQVSTGYSPFKLLYGRQDPPWSGHQPPWIFIPLLCRRHTALCQCHSCHPVNTHDVSGGDKGMDGASFPPTQQLQNRSHPGRHLSPDQIITHNQHHLFWLQYPFFISSLKSWCKN